MLLRCAIQDREALADVHSGSSDEDVQARAEIEAQVRDFERLIEKIIIALVSSRRVGDPGQRLYSQLCCYTGNRFLLLNRSLNGDVRTARELEEELLAVSGGYVQDVGKGVDEG